MTHRLVLINPNFQGSITRVAQTSVGPPLGLAYLASACRKAGVTDVIIVDANVHALSTEETVARVLDLAPDVVGLTATTPTIALAGEVAAAIKSRRPSVPILVGGPHSTALPERSLREFPAFDLVLRGEGEELLPRLIPLLVAGDWVGVQGHTGVAFLNLDNTCVDTGIAHTIADLDVLPFPARDLLPMLDYRCPDSDSFTTLLAMRGCPYNCVYCAVPTTHGKVMRYRTPESVVDEMEEVNEGWGIEFFSFLDDTFTTSRKWVLAFAEELERREFSRKIRWICLTRVDLVDAELLAAMKRAGCVRVEFGIESGSDVGRRFLKKGITKDQVVEGFRLAREAGLSTMGFVILNIPGESLDEVQETFELVRSADPDFLQVSLLTPYPGTELRTLAEKEGWIVTDDWSRYSFLNHVVLRHKFAPEEVERMYLDFVRRFYYRPGTIYKMARLVFNGTTRVRPLARTVLSGMLATALGKSSRMRWLTRKVTGR